MKRQEMNLNIEIYLSKDYWEKVANVYERTDGWLGFGGENGIPYWFSFNDNEKHITASVEPSGLRFSGQMEDEEWNSWKKKIKRIAAEELGFAVGEIELDEVECGLEALWTMTTSWTPISLAELLELIHEGVSAMSQQQRRVWEGIAVQPEKWDEEDYGKEGGSFWVVAICGQQVLWYNDVEEGFNISPFSEYGKIDEYWAEQD